MKRSSHVIRSFFFCLIKEQQSFIVLGFLFFLIYIFLNRLISEIIHMGNKVEKSSLDQNILDKLMEETGLEREVIIAWRFVLY